MDKYVSVIGGSHVTVSGTPFGKLSGEEHMGVVSLKLDGEARNISERLAHSGVNVKLITALGRDVFAGEITSVCEKLGIDYSASLTLDASTSVVVEIGDGSETAYTVCDYRVLRNMDIGFLSGKLDILNGAAACYVDAEFDSDKLEFLLSSITCPIFTDTVSVKSSTKLRGLLKFIHTLKPNKAELENLVGFSLITENNFRAATDILIQAGVKNVFVTCGKDGVWYNDGNEFGHIDAGNAIVVNRIGVGGAFNAALIKAFLENKSVSEQAEAGVKAALEFISGDNVVYL